MQQYLLSPMPTSSIPSVDRVYSNHVNPQRVKLLRTLDMNQQYGPCLGTELHTLDGRRILDFLSGYCVHNTGHNHPAIIEALKDELDRCGPVMLQSHVPELAAELAGRLSALAGGGLERVLFTNSGSEGVESAIKFARAHTGRTGMLYAAAGFHGLTCGALSLMSDGFWCDGFGPMLPDTKSVTFGELGQLERELATRKYAAFLVEPVQSEAGIRIPSPDYLRRAQDLCRRYGSLLVLDEVQTGMYRTGPFLAAHHFGVEPDMVILAKALSGGLVPVGAVLMTPKISGSVYASLQRALVHTSTFGENSLAMRAGLTTLDVLQAENLGERAARRAEDLRQRLSAALERYDMVADVRGVGMLSGIEFQTPRQLRTRVAFEAFRRVHPAMFGQVLVMRLYRDHGILTQVCGNNFMVLKVAPPLVVTEEQTIEFVHAVREVVEMAHESAAFWSEALGLARRALNP
jgi:ornithine--oxo-acid transaminase